MAYNEKLAIRIRKRLAELPIDRYSFIPAHYGIITGLIYSHPLSKKF